MLIAQGLCREKINKGGVRDRFHPRSAPSGTCPRPAQQVAAIHGHADFARRSHQLEVRGRLTAVIGHDVFPAARVGGEVAFPPANAESSRSAKWPCVLSMRVLFQDPT